MPTSAYSFIRHCLLCFVVVCAGVAQAAMQSLGPALASSSISNGMRFALQSGGTLDVYMYDGGIVRVLISPPNTQAIPTGAIQSFGTSSTALNTYDLGAQVYMVRDGLIVSIKRNPLQVVVYRSNGSVISADQPDGAAWDASTGLIALRKFAQANEGYYGLGLVGGSINRRGRVMVMRNTDSQEWTSASQPLYSSTPLVYGQLPSGTYGLILDTPATAWFDFDSQSNGTFTLASKGGAMDYTLAAAANPSEVSKKLSPLIGMAPLPPKWALGYIQAHFGYKSAEEYLGMAHEFRNRGIPCDAFFMDLDYLDQLKSMTWDPLTFPAPTAFMTELRQLGFQSVTIMEPSVTVFDPWWQTLADNGHLVTYRGAPGFPLINNIFLGDVSWVDFSKASARAAYGSRLTNFVAQGVGGLWADLNEPAANYMDEAVYDFDGKPRPDEQSRNIYALMETPVFRQAMLSAFPQKRPFVLSRGGFLGIHRYAANWSGDALSTFGSLQTAVEMSASMGLSGQPMFGHDIGGFLGSPNIELYLRWLQFGSVTTHMRTHSTFTSQPREPWVWGEPYNSLVKAQIEWRYRMLPTIYSLMAQASRTGEPVLAPMYYHFTDQANVKDSSSELMLGPKLLVAPVVVDGARSRTFNLPTGTWLDLATNQILAGGQTVTVPAPIERLPMLAQAGAIIPMGPVRPYATASVADDYMLLDIVAGAQGNFPLYEDDGSSNQYQQGSFRLTQLSWAETSTQAELTAASTGNYTPSAKPWWLQVRNWSQAPSAVSIGGVTLQKASASNALNATGAWFFDANKRMLVIRVPGMTTPSRVVIQR